MGKNGPDTNDYCFVLMPNVSIQTNIQPATGLSLLSAYLQGSGYHGRVIYANLLFITAMGLELTEHINEHPRTFLGDWLFAADLFPAAATEENVKGYMKELAREIPGYYFFGEENLRRHLLENRHKVENYLDGLVDRVIALKPRMVGCGVTFTQHIPALAFMKKLRKKAPAIITVLGGPSCETLMGATTHREFPWIDYVVSGEGDDIIVPLMAHVWSGQTGIPAASAPRGLFVPEHRQAGYPPPEEWLAVKENLADLPLPDYDDFFRAISELPGLERSFASMLPFEASRGCWWAQKKPCAFCSVNQVTSQYRGRPAADILAQLAALADKHQMTNFFAVDSILDMSHIQLLMPRLAAQNAPYRLFFEVTARLGKEHLRVMAAAGAVWVQPGIESLHSRALQLMNKGTEAWQNIQFLRHSRELGLFVTWMLLYGLPEEQDEWYGEMADLMPLIAHLQPPAFLNPILFMRNSAYFQEPERYGVKLRPFPINRYIWPDEPGVLENVAYLFENQGAVSHRGLRDGKYYSPPGWERVNKAVKTWNTAFYSPDQPQLVMTDSKGDLEILDTRPEAVRDRHILSGLSRWIYLACDTAPTEDELFRRLADEGVDRQVGETMVAMLRAYKLLLAIDGRFLALAVAAAPVVPEFFTRRAVRDMSAWAKSHQYDRKPDNGQ